MIDHVAIVTGAGSGIGCVVATDLTSSIRDADTRAGTEAYYAAMEQPLTATDVADAVMFAVEAPGHVCISNLTLPPTAMTR
ncbi:MAG: hypothetical protein GY894_00535 [Planctomycetes bacterium]|nr:hypothetical protein [Planctomycetota bacterium]MCP4837835.1 hypothetical protein [Planctomycetota bacterium]